MALWAWPDLQQLKLDILEVSSPQNKLGEPVEVSYQISNPSARDAVKTLDVFVGDDFASGLAPRKRVLVQFDRVTVPANEEVRGSITIRAMPSVLSTEKVR